MKEFATTFFLSFYIYWLIDNTIRHLKTWLPHFISGEVVEYYWNQFSARFYHKKWKDLRPMAPIHGYFFGFILAPIFPFSIFSLSTGWQSQFPDSLLLAVYLYFSFHCKPIFFGLGAFFLFCWLACISKVIASWYPSISGFWLRSLGCLEREWENRFGIVWIFLLQGIEMWTCGRNPEGIVCWGLWFWSILSAQEMLLWADCFPLILL